MKGMSTTLRLIVVAMVLVAVALILLNITSGGLTNFFGMTSKQQVSDADDTSDTMTSATCNIKRTQACNGNREEPSGWDTDKCGTFSCS